MWAGNNKVFFRGYVFMGSQVAYLCLTYIIMNAIALSFTALIAYQHYLVERNQTAVFIISVFLDILLNYLFFKAAFTEPGVIPKFKDKQGFQQNPKAVRGRMKKNTFQVNGQKLFYFIAKDTCTMRLSYCATCNIYKPLRVLHCFECDNCVIGFDHHCKWLGTCIGIRNYRSFIQLLSSILAYQIILLALIIEQIYYVVTFQNYSFSEYLKNRIYLPILFIATLIVFLFVVTLYGYHIKLMLKNQTTHESLLGYYDQIANPFERYNWLKNLYNRLWKYADYKSHINHLIRNTQRNKIIDLKESRKLQNLTGLEALSKQVTSHQSHRKNYSRNLLKHHRLPSSLEQNNTNLTNYNNYHQSQNNIVSLGMGMGTKQQQQSFTNTLYTPNNDAAKTQPQYEQTLQHINMFNIGGAGGGGMLSEIQDLSSNNVTPSNANHQNKKIVISRKNIQIEESRVFDNNEEICNNDQLKRIEKHKNNLMFKKQNSYKNQSIITINYPTTSINEISGAHNNYNYNRSNHTRIQSNLYGGQSIMSNYNPGSPRHDLTNNDMLNTILPQSFIQPYQQVFEVNDDDESPRNNNTKDQSPFWIKPDLKEAELVIQIDNKGGVNTSQDLTTQQNYSTNNKLTTEKGLKNKLTAAYTSSANNTGMNQHQKTYSSNIMTMTSANKILQRDNNGIRRINFKNFMPQSYHRNDNSKLINFEMQPLSMQNINNTSTRQDFIRQTTPNNNQLQMIRDLSQSNFSQIQNEVQFSEESQNDQKTYNTQSRLKYKSANKHLQSIDSMEENDGYFDSESRNNNEPPQQIIDVFTHEEQNSQDHLNFLRSSNILENNRVFDNLNQQNTNHFKDKLRNQNEQSQQSNNSLKLTLNLNLYDAPADYGDHHHITRNANNFSVGSVTKLKRISKHKTGSSSTKKKSFIQTMKSVDSSFSHQSKKSKTIFHNNGDVDLNESQSSVEIRRRKETLEDILMGDHSSNITYSNQHTLSKRRIQVNYNNSSIMQNSQLQLNQNNNQQLGGQNNKNSIDKCSKISVEELYDIGNNNMRFQFEKSIDNKQQRDSTITIKFKDPSMSIATIKNESLNQSIASRYDNHQETKSRNNNNNTGSIMSGAITKKSKIRQTQSDLMIIQLDDDLSKN